MNDASITTCLTVKLSQLKQPMCVIGTLGSVSHGKSTLVELLSKHKPHRFSAEKDRDCTIYLGYENFKICRTSDGKLYSIADNVTPNDQVVLRGSLVDCPGHKEYIDVATGATSIMNNVLLVIAANEPIQSQTHQHMLAYMSNSQLNSNQLIVHNKIDLVTKADALKSKQMIADHVNGSIFETAPIIPTSFRTGKCTKQLLELIVDRFSPRDKTYVYEGPGLMHAVRSFDLNRNGKFNPKSPLTGAAIGGTIAHGVFKLNDLIEIKPGLVDCTAKTVQPLYTTVKSIHSGCNALEYAIPGATIAICTDLDPSIALNNNMSGQLIGHVGTLSNIVDSIDVPITRAYDISCSRIKSVVNMKVKVNFKTMVVTGIISSKRTKKHKHKKRTITIQLDSPICIEVGQHVAVLSNNSILLGHGNVTACSLVKFTVIDKYRPEPYSKYMKVIVENDREPTDSSKTNPTYDDMIALHQFTTTKQSVKIPSIKIDATRVQVEVTNIVDVIDVLDDERSNVDWWSLITTYIDGRYKMRASKAYQNKTDVLRIKGNRLNAHDVERMIRSFISEIVCCSRCKKSIRCILTQERGKKISRNCLDCGALSTQSI